MSTLHVERWQRFTGEVATLADTGQPFAVAKAERAVVSDT